MSASYSLLLACDGQHNRIADAAGRFEALVSYAPYGYSVPQAFPVHTAYTGLYLERVTACYMAGSGRRVFNPNLMRFNSPDRLSPFDKGGINCYAYCEGDPINWQDRSGQSKDKLRRQVSERAKMSLARPVSMIDQSFTDEVINHLRFRRESVVERRIELMDAVDFAEGALDKAKDEGGSEVYGEQYNSVLRKLSVVMLELAEENEKLNRLDGVIRAVRNTSKKQAGQSNYELNYLNEKKQNGNGMSRERLGTWPSANSFRGR